MEARGFCLVRLAFLLESDTLCKELHVVLLEFCIGEVEILCVLVVVGTAMGVGLAPAGPSAGHLVGLFKFLEDVEVCGGRLAPFGGSPDLVPRFFIAEDGAHFVSGLILDLVQFLQFVEDLLEWFVGVPLAVALPSTVVSLGFLHFRI